MSEFKEQMHGPTPFIIGVVQRAQEAGITITYPEQYDCRDYQGAWGTPDMFLGRIIKEVERVINNSELYSDGRGAVIVEEHMPQKTRDKLHYLLGINPDETAPTYQDSRLSVFKDMPVADGNGFVIHQRVDGPKTAQPRYTLVLTSPVSSQQAA